MEELISGRQEGPRTRYLQLGRRHYSGGSYDLPTLKELTRYNGHQRLHLGFLVIFLSGNGLGDGSHSGVLETWPSCIYYLYTI